MAQDLRSQEIKNPVDVAEVSVGPQHVTAR
jgi:hypothetical protein